MERNLGTHEIAGWKNGIISLEQNSPDMLADGGDYRGAGRCWAAFDASGTVIGIYYNDDNHNPRGAALSASGQVAVAPFMASCTELVLELSESVLTGRIHPNDPTLGFTGSITYGDGNTVEYVRGVSA